MGPFDNVTHPTVPPHPLVERRVMEFLMVLLTLYVGVYHSFCREWPIMRQ